MPSFTKNSFTMHYEMQGTGEPVLCIMGITASGEVWEDHVAEWSKHFLCITPDNRGVGLTDKPTGDYSSEQMADDYAHLMEHLNIQSAHLIGCSMGSVIAQQLAIRHPSKVRSAVLMCSWARCDAFAKSTFSHILQAKAHLKTEDFIEYIQLLIFAKRSWDNPEMYQSFLDARREAASAPFPQPLHALEGQCAACTNHNTLDQLQNLVSPTLVIGGENDVFTPKWMAEELHTGLPHSTLHLYPDSGHAFHWENLEDFNQRVIDFIKLHH